MASDRPSQPGTNWYATELGLRKIDLRADLLRQLSARREGIVRRMHEIYGPTLPTLVQSNIDKQKAVDLERKAETLARLITSDVRRNLATEFRDSGDAALAIQINNSIRIYEERHGLGRTRTIDEIRAEIAEKRTAVQELARAREVHERHPSHELATAINRWTHLLETAAEDARRLARLPLATVHDADLYLLVSGGSQQRADAAEHLLERGFITAGIWLDEGLPGRHRVKAELNRLRAEKGHDWVQEWLRNVILPAALVLAADELKHGEPARMRLGKRWLLDVEGRQAVVEPWELTDDEMVDWLRTRAMNHAEEGILDLHPGARTEPVSLDVPVGGRRGGDGDSEGLPRLLDAIAAPDLTPEEAILAKEEARRLESDLRRFVDRFSSLSPEDQRLLALHADGHSYRDLAGILGAKPPALRKRVERLKKGLRVGESVAKSGL